MTTKTIKTVLFAALILSIVVPMTSFNMVNADNSQSKKDFLDQKVNDFKELKKQQRELQKQLKNLDDSDTATQSDIEAQIDDLSRQITILQDEVKQGVKVEKTKSDKLDKAFTKIGKTFLDESSKKFTDSNIVDVFVDPVGEQIVIMTSGEVSAEHQDLIKNKLAKNVNVIFVEGEDLACSNRSNCTPIRGGLKITASSGVTIKTSTLGFFATQTDGDSGFITTSHSTYLNQDVKHNGSVIGTTTDKVSNTSCDCAFVELASGTSTWSNSVYKTAATTYYITGYENKANTSVGDFVVMSGYTSDIESGLIVAFGWWGMVYTTIDATYGDSGAPVLEANDKIVGIIKGEGFIINPHGTWTYYSAYDDIKTALSLS